MRKCPKCSSYNVEPYLFQSAEVIKCNECGYDEGAEFEQYPAEKASQKAKGKYTRYKTGGSSRTRKSKK